MLGSQVVGRCAASTWISVSAFSPEHYWASLRGLKTVFAVLYPLTQSADYAR